MREMTAEEALEFLSAGTRTGKLAWVASDGRPHVAPMWFVVGDGDLLLVTHERTGKARALARDGRASLVVDLEEPPYAFAKVDGTVEMSDDPDEVLRVATLTGARYMGADRAAEYGAAYGGAGMCVMRLRPSNITGLFGLADLD